MKAADVWNQAADIAEMWAAVGRARARRLIDAWQEDVAEQTAENYEHLARAFRYLANTDHRDVDFDDRPTPVFPTTVAGLLVLDDDPTDPM